MNLEREVTQTDAQTARLGASQAKGAAKTEALVGGDDGTICEP